MGCIPLIRLGLLEQVQFPLRLEPPGWPVSPPSACDVQDRVTSCSASGSQDRTIFPLRLEFPRAELGLLRLTGELSFLKGFLEEFAVGLRTNKWSSGEVLPPFRTLAQNPADFILKFIIFFKATDSRDYFQNVGAILPLGEHFENEVWLIFISSQKIIICRTDKAES